MQRAERLGDVGAGGRGRALLERSALEPRRERAARDVLHDQPRVIRVLPGVEGPHGVWVVDGPCGPDLASEPGAGAGVVQELRVEALDGDGRPRADVRGAPDLGHATAPDPLLEA